MNNATIDQLVRPANGSSQPWFCTLRDGTPWLVKFAGAGPGRDALTAELVANLLGRELGLPIPATRPVFLGPTVARAGTDEFWDVLAASQGWNLAIREIPGAVSVVPSDELPRETRAAMACFDAVTANWDRTALSRNLLRDPSGELWWIDHGSCRFLHHLERRGRQSLPSNHFAFGTGSDPVPAPLPPPSPDTIEAITSSIPDEWLSSDPNELAAALSAYLESALG